MLLRFLRNRKGFTMIEMMVVLIIIGVLIGVGISFYSGYIGKSQRTKAKSEISVMQAALDSYYAERNVYPSDSDLTGLSAAGIDTSLVTVTPTDTTKKYCYQTSTNNLTYVITTTTKQGDKYIVGEGSYGKSSAPVEQDAQDTTPPDE